MDLTAVKERIRGEQMKGDIKIACRKAGVDVSTFRCAMTKETVDELRPRELKSVVAMIDVLDERVKMKQKLAKVC